jgi:hypothetical protein
MKWRCGGNGSMDVNHRISGKNLAQDILTGMGDGAIMAKYGLSPKGIERLFKKLLKSKLITPAELYTMSSLYKIKIDTLKNRRHPRADLAVRIPIYDISSSSVGLLRDVSETGLRVAGITAEPGNVKTFQIPVDMYIEADPLLVIAQCKWAMIKGNNRKYFVAGFELQDVSDHDAGILRDFIEFLLFSKSGEWQTLD